MMSKDDSEADYVGPPLEPELGPPLPAKSREPNGTVLPERTGPILQDEIESVAWKNVRSSVS
jgi:hypothetical protein